MRVEVMAFAAMLVLAAANEANALSSCGSGGVVGKQQKVLFQGSLYYVTTPANYDPGKAWPLVFGMHGDEGSPTDSINLMWNNTAYNGGLILVAPQAPNQALPDEGRWYAQQDSNQAWMDGLLKSLLAQYNIDVDRITAFGNSGGAIFLSDYMLVRQDVFAAVELNFGGGYDGQKYFAPKRAECRIPVRFADAPGDFLRAQMQAYKALLDKNQHQTVWADAACTDQGGHCWDSNVMGVPARDWLLSRTLCGATITSGCAGVEGRATDGGVGDAGSSRSESDAANSGGQGGAPEGGSAQGGGQQGDGQQGGGAGAGPRGMVDGAAAGPTHADDGGRAIVPTGGAAGSSSLDGSAATADGMAQDASGCACRVARAPRGGASSFCFAWLVWAMRRRRRAGTS